MRTEEQLLLQLLRDHIQGRPTALPAGSLDWDYLVRLCASQHVSGIAYCQLRESLDAGARDAMHNEFMRAVFLHTCQLDEFREVSEALSRADIPFLPMKGIHLCRYYPAPPLRSMSDIDLVIRPADRQRCHRVLEEMGFHCSRDLQEVWTYRRDMVAFEVHDWMVYKNLASDFDYRAYFSHIWDHTVSTPEGLRIDPSYHFLFLIVHLAKHVLHAGCGFRSYMDLVVMSRAEELDYGLIDKELQKMGLRQFAGVCFALCRHWFGVEIPMLTPQLPEEFLRTVTEKTLRDGAFGLENADNETGGIAKAVKQEGGAYWPTAIRIVVGNIFPSYQDMRLVPAYSFVDGRPWLLPAAWIYRFCYCLKKKFNFSRRKLLTPLTQRRKVLSRKALMDRWGL